MNAKKLSLAFGILSASLLSMGASVVGTAIAAISKSFPHEPISKVQMVSTIPQIGQIIVTLIFAWLTYHVTRKNIGLLSILFVGIGGLIPAFWNNSLNVILACMVLLGFGTGLISNITPVLIQEHFKGEERATVMGWQVGFMNGGMMLITFLGGILGAKNWHNLFYIFIIAFIVLILFYFIVPQDKKTQEVTPDTDHKPSFFNAFKGLRIWVYVIFALTLVLSVIMTAFMANESIVLAVKGHGTSYTALITALGNIGGIITALFLGKIRKFTKQYTLAWGFVSFFLSFICVLYTNNIVFHVLGNVFSGVGIVMVNATIPFLLSSLADEAQFPVVISINTLISSIAGAIAPIILAALKVGAGNAQYILGFVLSIIVAALLVIFKVGNRIQKVTNN